MKRTLAMTLAIAVAGCGPQEPGKASSTQSPAPQNPQPTATEAAPYVIRPLGTTGSDWRIIAVSGERPNRLVEMIDLKSIVTSGSIRRMWMARVSEGEGDTSYVLVFDEYDCDAKTAKNLNMARTDRDGKLSTIEGIGRVENVIPGTMGSNYLQYACGTMNSNNRIPVGVDPILHIRDQFNVITEQHLTEALEVLVRRENNKLSLPESRTIFLAFKEISKKEKDRNVIDTPSEKADLGIVIRSTNGNRAVWLDLFNALRLAQ